MLSTIVITGSLVTMALGHAVMQTPTPREAGPVHEQLCGAAVADRLADDIAGPLENSVAVIDEDYDCNLFLCRGYQYEDNVENVQALAAGDIVAIHIDIIAGHTPGYANISIVDTAENEMIGEPLKIWDDVLSSDPDVPNDERDFNITVPSDLPSACSEGGNCVVQWYWYATGNEQTYISCLDFTI